MAMDRGMNPSFACDQEGQFAARLVLTKGVIMSESTLKTLEFLNLTLVIGGTLILSMFGDRARLDSWREVILPKPAYEHGSYSRQRGPSIFGLREGFFFRLLLLILLFSGGATAHGFGQRIPAVAWIAIFIVYGALLLIAIVATYRLLGALLNSTKSLFHRTTWGKRVDARRLEAWNERNRKVREAEQGRQARCMHQWREHLLANGSVTSCIRCGKVDQSRTDAS